MSNVVEKKQINQYIVPAIFVVALLWRFIGSNPTKPFQTIRQGNDAVTTVDGSDPKMQLIIQNARETLPEFLKSMNNPAVDERNFTVKYPFDTDKGSDYTVEHIWLGDIVENDGKYRAMVINDPFEIKSLKYGDTVDIDINKISDWKYERGGKIVGGQSIKYLIENVPESERSADEIEYLKLF